MAAVTEREWLTAVDLLVDALDELPIGQVESLCRQGRAKFDAAEARRLASTMADERDTKSAARAASNGGKRSKRGARRAARRAAAIKRNPGLAADMDAGRLSTDQADVLADAAAKSDGAAACDQGLIDAVAAAGVDQGRRIAQDWLEKRADQKRLGDEHDRQRRMRRAASYFDGAKGVRAIKLEGDNATLAELWTAIEQHERRLWDADGGRDVPTGEHRRTRDQRLFDAAVEMLLGTARSGSGGRPATVVSINANQPDHPAVMVGHGPIPDTVALDILVRSDLFVNLLDAQGQTMWFGRARRNATTAQFIALAVRDRGCVRCNAHWSRCEVHHLLPWNAPARGKTDIDKLALVCSSCHHDLHDNALTLERKGDERWTVRPALDHELAPRRRTQSPPNQHERASNDMRPAVSCGEHVRCSHQYDTARPPKQPAAPESDDEAA